MIRLRSTLFRSTTATLPCLGHRRVASFRVQIMQEVGVGSWHMRRAAMRRLWFVEQMRKRLVRRLDVRRVARVSSEHLLRVRRRLLLVR